MNHKKLLTLGLTLLLVFPTLSLIGCGGCSNTHTMTQKTTTTNNANPDPTYNTHWDLSPQAREIYAVLAFDEALRSEDVSLLLESLETLKQCTLPAEMYIQATSFLMNKKIDAAMNTLTTGLKAYPDDAFLNMLYAETMLSEGNINESMQHMRRYLKQHPTNIDARLELALILLKNKNFQEAEEVLQAIPAAAHTATSELAMARAQIGLGRDHDALAHLHASLRLEADSVETLAELAYLHERHKTWKSAQEAYEKIRSLRGDTPEILLRIIYTSLRLQDVTNALKTLKQGPENLDFRLAAAGLFLELEQPQVAQQVLQELEEYDGAPEELNLYLAELIWRQQQDAPAALAKLDKISEQASCAAQAALLRAQILYAQGKKEDTATVLLQGQKRFPNMQEFALAYCRLLASQHEFTTALELAQKNVEQWPNSVEVLFLLATLQDELNMKPQAFANMKKILDMNPDYHPAMNYVGYTLAEENRDLDYAQALLLKAVRLSPESAYIWDSLAWAQFRANKLKDAWQSISKAVSLDDDIEATIWEHYGDIAAKLGKKKEARKGYNNAIKANGNNATLQKKLSEL